MTKFRGDESRKYSGGKDGRKSARSGVLPVVFCGLSIKEDAASEILTAVYRPPIRRGDLKDVPAGSLAVIIDGVFDQHLAVTPTEIREAIARGIMVFGASSMGALRSVEVAEMIGIGRVYEMYANGELENDDEVAVIFEPRTQQVLSEPLVNVRHAAARLARTGTIGHDLALRIVEAAGALPYCERTYPDILRAAGLADSIETTQLGRMLAAIDLKREDAVSVLEHVQRWRERDNAPARRRGTQQPARAQQADARTHTVSPAQASVHLWEFGPPVRFRDVVDFMAITGSLWLYARPAYRLLLESGDRAMTCRAATDSADLAATHGALLAKAARNWQWATEEEVATSLDDLGLTDEVLHTLLLRVAEADCVIGRLLRENDPSFMLALRTTLFVDDLALKRETARLLCLRSLAEAGKRLGPVTAAERNSALNKACRMLDKRDAAAVLRALSDCGVGTEASDRLVTELACARRIRMVRNTAPEMWPGRHRWLRPCAKANGSRRFCTPLEDTHAVVKRLQSAINITRVSIITGLGTIGIPNAQAFRPDGEWSSTVGSGKSDSEIGAKVGAVMEEIEKWSQERFSDRHGDTVAARASYRGLARTRRDAVDPALLDLPYDTCYNPDLEIEWYRCEELLSGRDVLAPAAAFTHRRLVNDIYFSLRGARKTVTTNGLAAGMTISEALTHALCEFIERHHRSMDFIVGENPGTPIPSRPTAVDPATMPKSIAPLTRKIAGAGYRLVVRDIRTDIWVPTFSATILLPDGLMPGGLHGDGWRRASGWASHPDPETALKMAVLEASQTVMSHIAGAREDLALNARSLGRHERSESRREAAILDELDGDLERQDFASIRGYVTADAAKDVRWLLARLKAAGCDHVIAVDYSRKQLAPVRAVRVVVPGLETINAFHTGLRARRALIADLLPAAA